MYRVYFTGLSLSRSNMAKSSVNGKGIQETSEVNSVSKTMI